jgi:branched-chain amino acid transport system substrate-binding protein
MKFTKLATVALVTIAVSVPVAADLMFPSLSYRTGPYASGGTPFADGYADFFTLMNERDGGIGGAKVVVEECETGFSTPKGVECYEATKNNGALLYQPLSTGMTYQLIPKATADGIPLLTSGYGRTAAADGTVFPWVFNFPTNYWAGASRIINHILDTNDGSLEGKSVALLYHNSGYGKEPIRTLEALAKKHGFALTLLPVDHPGQEQKSQWLQIRRERPDFLLMWGWGVMNQVAMQEASNIRYPMDNFYGIWWSGTELDVLPGMASDGYKAANFSVVGSDFEIYGDLQTHVIDKGLAAGTGASVGSVIYNRGLYAGMVAAEAVRNAQSIHGVADITASMMRDGLDSLNMDNAAYARNGMTGFGPEFAVTCENHGGNGMSMIQEWDGSTQQWKMISGFEAPDMEVIAPLIKADAAAYAAENNITPRDC